ncbi:hypothetical protein PT974_06036 [Cladobotryum mycophilum]|uniref:Nineteen complex-related protein 2-domain-containing protein n=1 Tax=Cladobotryum mycophilum TaxID=491253 RepID=A0ABR0SKE1_9HYPO
MSSFGAKRKARVIKVDDDEENTDGSPPSTESGSSKEEPVKPSFGSKSGRKPFRQSGLRKAFNPADDDDGKDESAKDNEEGDDGPVVVRPNANRSGSVKQKKIPKSKLSFGGDAGGADDGDGEKVNTPKKAPLGQRIPENSALRRGMAARGLPLPVRSFQDEDDRPKYSKEYLNELQSSTPNTPRDLSSLPVDDGDEMDLDPSELEGALIVDSPAPPPARNTTQILTEAEIREKKERRARLAKEQNFLSVDDDDDNDEDDDGLSGRKKKDDTRLVAEDEDLGEGFDEYVEDGGLSLGKRAEKERRKQDRRQIAELINAAEGHTSDSSSDSDAERRIAYETAQTRAGLDGLKKPRKDPSEQLLQVPPKITPLPNLSECLAQLQLTLKTMEDEIKAKSATVASLTRERNDIVTREAEVQAFLNETGRKYQEAMGQKDVTMDGLTSTGPGIELTSERGLESLGATPMQRPEENMD